MDLLKASIYILVVMMGINAATYMMAEVGMTYMTPYNVDDINTNLDVDGFVDDYTDDDPQFYNIGAALIKFWKSTVPIIESFPATLAAYGCPDFIYVPLLTIWRFMWLGAVTLGVIAGRQT